MPVRATPVNRANHLSTLNGGFYVPVNGPVNNCNNTLCFTYNLIDQIIDFFLSKVKQSLMPEHNSLW